MPIFCIILVSLSPFQLANLVLIMVAVVVVFKYLETFWSYKISKPYAWEMAVKSKEVSKTLQITERTFRDKVRFYQLWFLIRQLKNNQTPGAFAELGVHQGKTAKAIHHMDDDRICYLFDTFKGFTNQDLAMENQKDARFSTAMFADTSIEKVKKHIKGNKNVVFKPGFFPNTAADVTKETFAFVHIDADLYAPTKAALQFFYPKLSKGGMILVHDYHHNWEGIPKAIDEFINTIPESIIPLPDRSGSVMIIKNQ